MPKRPASKKSPSLPTKDDIAAYLKDAKGKVGKRELARAFNLDAQGRIWLKETLREMEDGGVLSRTGKRLHKAGDLPPVVLADIVKRDRDGDLIAKPVEWDEDRQGPTPIIHVLTPRKPRPHQPAPGLNDRALIRVERDNEAWHGRVIKILDKAKTEAIGIFRSTPHGGGRIVPVDKKALGREWAVAPGDEGEASDGDLVSISLSGQPRAGLAKAKVKERLGAVNSEKALSLIAIHTHGLPHVFSRQAVQEAEQAKAASMEGREDWRTLPLITIDPVDAKDHDDAVHAKADDSPNNPGGFIVTVAIADVAAYVRSGSPLDKDALERGNSVYFPDRVVPMLPERISNDLCSLRPLEDRPALAMRMVLSADGRKLSHSVHRVMMRSAAKLSYQQAQAAIDGRPDDTTQPLLDPVLKPLWAAYACAAKARDAREPLFLDLPERKILLKTDGTVDRVIQPPRLDAHKLIEEFMILANVCAAESLEAAGSPIIYRTHDEPSVEKMRALGEVLASIGLKLPKQGALKPALFNRILAQVANTEHQAFVNEVVLRSQAQAEYVSDNYGHFGLNLRRYAHFTSPIRRYADLIVHRALISALRLGSDGLSKDTTAKDLGDISAQISAAERRAMAAERETIDRLIAHHLMDQIGATFEGAISGVTRSGLFVKLDGTGADGFIPASTLGDDYFHYDDKRHAMIGRRSGETFRLGDRTKVRLVEAAPVAGALRFEIAGDDTKARRTTFARKKERPFKPVSKKAKTRIKTSKSR